MGASYRKPILNSVHMLFTTNFLLYLVSGLLCQYILYIYFHHFFCRHFVLFRCYVSAHGCSRAGRGKNFTNFPGRPGNLWKLGSFCKQQHFYVDFYPHITNLTSKKSAMFCLASVQLLENLRLNPWRWFFFIWVVQSPMFQVSWLCFANTYTVRT